MKKATKYSHLDNDANGHKSGEASLLPQYDEIEEKEGIRCACGIACQCAPWRLTHASGSMAAARMMRLAMNSAKQ